MSQAEYVLGIDPGLKGALTLLSPQAELIGCVDMPTLANGKYLHEAELCSILANWKFIYKNIICFIEDTITPVYRTRDGKIGQDVKAVRTTSVNFGLIRGMLASNDIYYEIIAPNRWEGKMLAGLPKPRTKKSKSRSYFACKAYYPSIDLVNGHVKGKENMDGRADSALIARYGWHSWNSRIKK